MRTVVGAGAVGLALAARLARAGLPVRVVTRDPRAAQRIASGGIDNCLYLLQLLPQPRSALKEWLTGRIKVEPELKVISDFG